jgi:MarR family transcriptional regulator, transcriptional regulator for hemolysin
MASFDYEHNPGFVINRTARGLSRSLDSRLRNTVGISFAQWRVLVLLTKSRDSLSQKEIADALGLEAPTLIPILDKLQNDGFVERRVDSSDRRNNRIFLTEKTITIWDITLECATNVLATALTGIPDEQIQIMKEVMEKMWSNLQTSMDPQDRTSAAFARRPNRRDRLREASVQYT